MKKQKRHFDTKIQYCIDAQLNKDALRVLKRKGIPMAVYLRSKIDRLKHTNGHINIDSATKQYLIKYCDDNNTNFSELIEQWLTEVVQNNNVGDFSIEE